jgi:hypothetical protein
MKTSAAVESVAADIAKALESFEQNGSAAKQALNQLASSDPATFFSAGIRVVASSKPTEGSRFLIQTLAKDKRLSIGLLDPQVCTVGEAMAVTRAAAEAGAQLQSTFEMALNKALQGQASAQNGERILRILAILSVTCSETCWNSFQVELMAYPDKVVRSKAALLIGRSTGNAQWIGRRLLDRDPRVQASAVEALWGLDAAESKPHFQAALKSRNNRVAGNAALGLYLIGDVTAMRVLLDMLRHEDPLFRLSALWAIGQTHDERFLPTLTEYYKQAEGKLRLGVVTAMAKIRRREKTVQNPGPLQVHMSQAMVQPNGRRRITFALSCHPARDLSGIKPMEFSVWENEKLIEDYEVRQVNPPALLMVGFVAPWLGSGDEPYETSLREAWKQCLAMKRRDDLWRIDRYSIEINPGVDEDSVPGSLFPYDESLATAELKGSQGCIAEPDLLRKVFDQAVPLDRVAAEPPVAIQRQCDVFSRRGGKRHIFLFLHSMSGFDLKRDAEIARLRTMTQEGSVVLHAVCPDVAGEWSLLRELCLSQTNGSFTQCRLEEMVDGLVDAYANLCSRFEVSYSLPQAAAPGTVKLKISGERGCGEAEVSLDSSLAPQTPQTAEAPVQSA